MKSEHINAHASRKSTIVLFGEVLEDTFPDRSVLGGAPFNVARHLKAFAQNPVLITRLGNDAVCEKVFHVMLQNQMVTLGIQRDKSYPSGQVQVQNKEGENHFDIRPMQAYDFIHPAIVRMISLSVHPDMVYFGTLAQREQTSRHALKTLLRSSKARKFLDVNLRTPWYDEKTLRQSMQMADIVKLNAEELGILAEMFELPQGSPQEHALALIEQFNIEQIIVTCGEEGVWLINRDGKIFRHTGIKVPIANLVDTVGAGDGFSAVFILGTLRRWSIATTLERANTFAAAICGIRGAVPDHTNFYAPFLADWNR